MATERELEILKEIEARMSRLDAADKASYERKLQQAKEVENQNARYEKQEKILKQINIELDDISRESDTTRGITNDILSDLTKSNVQLKHQKNIASALNKIAYQTLSTRMGEMDINKKSLENFQQQAGVRRSILQGRQQELKSNQNRNKSQERELNTVNDLLGRLKSTEEVNDRILKTDQRIESSIGNTAGLLKGLDKSLQKAGFGSLGIASAFAKTKREAQELEFTTGKIQKGTQLLGKFAKNVFDNFKDGLSTTKLLELAILAVYKAMVFIDSNSGKLAKNLGTSNEKARELVSNFNEMSMQTGNIFINTANLTEAFNQLTGALGVTAVSSAKLLENQVELTKQAGYSVESATQLAKLGAIQGTDSKGVLQNFLGQAEALNLQNNTSINSKALAESALKTSKATLLSLRGQGKSLAGAAFEAKKLGLELSQIEGIADSLLNIESSIAAEFEAEVITGKQLNLERARFYALTNNIEGLSKEIAKNVGSTADFAKMNRIEQEAIAKSVGMSRDSLGEMLFEQEALSKLSAKQGEDAQAAFNRTVKEKGMKEAIRQLGDAQLKDQLQANNVQERFTASMQKLQTLFLNLAEPLMPVVDAFVSILGTVGGLVARFTPLLGFLVKAYALVKGIGLAFKGIQMTRAAIFSLGKQQLATDIASKNTTAIQNTYLKVKEAFTNRGYVAAKAAYILEKIGLINAKQLAYWKGRETFFSKAKNRNLGTTAMYEKASLLSSIRRNIADKVGVATAKIRSITEKGTLSTYIAQGIAKAFNNVKDRIALGIAAAKTVAETTILGSMIAQGAAAIVSIARQGILLGITVAKAAAEFAAATAGTLGIGTGPLIALAAIAAAAVGGIIYSMVDDAKFEPKTPGYGKRELHDEGKITLFNDSDTIVAGTDLDKRSKNPPAAQPSTQFNQSLDYEKLAITLGGVINDKQVTLSYTDFAQKTRPVFG